MTRRARHDPLHRRRFANLGAAIKTAFIAGAGLGRRLRPLTEHRPKPLVPVFNKPLVTYVLDALCEVGIETVVINTHHCAEAYAELLDLPGGRGTYQGLEIECIHEPVLLETGGGIRNAAGILGDGPVLVHNGDVLCAVDLAGLFDAHSRNGCEVTAHLRSFGGPLQIAYDSSAQRIRDFRGTLGRVGDMDCLFSGIYVIERSFIERIPANEIISVVPVFLDMLRSGVEIAGVCDDSGVWADLGNREAYLDAHALPGFADGKLLHTIETGALVCVDPTAKLGEGVRFEGFAAVGAHAVIGDNTLIKDTVIWNHAKIASGACLTRCIVRDHQVAEGTLIHTDV